MQSGFYFYTCRNQCCNKTSHFFGIIAFYHNHSLGHFDQFSILRLFSIRNISIILICRNYRCINCRNIIIRFLQRVLPLRSKISGKQNRLISPSTPKLACAIYNRVNRSSKKARASPTDNFRHSSTGSVTSISFIQEQTIKGIIKIIILLIGIRFILFNIIATMFCQYNKYILYTSEIR